MYIHVLHVATAILTPQNIKFIPENMHKIHTKK